VRVAVVVLEVVASYFAAENTGVDLVEKTAVEVVENYSEIQSYLAYEGSVDDLCYLGTENLGSAS
tara:strand:- start:703 stop:897 length:195 start_codon:yes stop_codon:yes gene_type:complete